LLTDRAEISRPASSKAAALPHALGKAREDNVIEGGGHVLGPEEE